MQTQLNSNWTVETTKMTKINESGSKARFCCSVVSTNTRTHIHTDWTNVEKTDEPNYAITVANGGSGNDGRKMKKKIKQQSNKCHFYIQTQKRIPPWNIMEIKYKVNDMNDEKHENYTEKNRITISSKWWNARTHTDSHGNGKKTNANEKKFKHRYTQRETEIVKHTSLAAY